MCSFNVCDVDFTSQPSLLDVTSLSYGLDFWERKERRCRDGVGSSADISWPTIDFNQMNDEFRRLNAACYCHGTVRLKSNRAKREWHLLGTSQVYQRLIMGHAYVWHEKIGYSDILNLLQPSIIFVHRRMLRIWCFRFFAFHPNMVFIFRDPYNWTYIHVLV